MSSEQSQDWTEVLARCEAAAAEAEALLDHRATFDPDRFAELTAVDLWSLSLPALPDELHERARAVHQRQLSLQADLIAAMTDVRHEIAMFAAAEPPPGPSRYLDRSA
ncbi:hypothetical protein M6D93_16815 [Jatrophihabitans telluris]|uniref:Flagellar protein FliT n=1 Tax=Jatrophihabitans telluris TaxID=2038343 RepID=A0ABY4QXF6_9ACTN|nr:hypothetical protein [Jatrophihabitans telluris]UQX87947.1 hypothetical protein M6D93_16815 [Jatrophihabitans telluris]